MLSAAIFAAHGGVEAALFRTSELIARCLHKSRLYNLSRIKKAGGMPAFSDLLERFRAKWVPVRVKKTRQNKKLELRL
ncbi:hypothetical protein [Bradyrhizobium cenepequi]|uniref:hypothetical protein n=1 Tax=Bradyrhizobium cenepequi TaxID=2821403 RepID=UPI001CE32106|nr:hypothetical protein [Bradyrhizobium cenepequi]MCA6105736.1 hypothetical protein [Bradyrhizobium cenepequi]